MNYPSYLKPGDRVGLVATARWTEAKVLEMAEALLRQWDLLPIRAEEVLERHHQYAGTDNHRLKNLQALLDDPSIKAIWCLRGGYGSMRIIDAIKWDLFMESPKWIIGYSDVTALHSMVNHLGIPSMHCFMPFDLGTVSQASIHSLKQALFGEEITYDFESNSKNRLGKASGMVVGGNLSLIHAQLGSKSQLNTSGKLLFLEDVDEYLYHIDRMFIGLRRAGLLDELAGLLIGGFTKVHDNEKPFGMTLEEIVLDACWRNDFPIAFGFPAGHQPENCSLILGRSAELLVEDQGSKLQYDNINPSPSTF